MNVIEDITQEENKKWLTERLGNRKKSFFLEPDLYVGMWKNERSTTDEYNGRQLLELIQNADDAIPNGKNGKIKIELNGTTLTVSNTGIPFSQGGVKSLMTPHNSSKQVADATIGNKGLGFRSVLNWSNKLHINSGGFHLEFSRENAVDFLEKIYTEKPEIKEDIQATKSEEYPIATLCVPLWKEKLKTETGYDTVISMEVNEGVLPKIEEQIEDIDLEVLLFLTKLNEIILVNNGVQEVIKVKNSFSNGKKTIVKWDSEGNVRREKTWTIHTPKNANREIPINPQNPEQSDKPRKYDLKIAVSDDLDDKLFLLCNYFKTNVSFPFPAIVHATLELSGNRNQINETEVNRYILGKLVEFMVEVAEKIKHKEVDWHAAKLLAPQRDLSPVLEDKMKFLEMLRKATEGATIFPTVTDNYQAYSTQLSFTNSTAITKILEKYKGHNFTFVLKQCGADLKKGIDRIFKLNDKIGFNKFSLFNNLSDKLDIKDRAQLIYLFRSQSSINPLGGWHQLYYIRNNMPSLLLNDKGGIVSNGSRIILPRRREARELHIPDWIGIDAISKELYEEIQRFNENKIVGKDDLESFDVEDYRFGDIVSRVIKKAIEVKSGKELAEQQGIIRNLVTFLLKNFNASSPETFDKGQEIPLLSSKGEIVNADKLLLGEDYGVNDNVKILETTDADCFVASPDDLGITHITDEIKVKFLIWLGVKEKPTLCKLTLNHRDKTYQSYLKYALENLAYPVKIGTGETFHSYHQLSTSINRNRPTDFELTSLDYLEEIVKTGNIYDFIDFAIKNDEVKGHLLAKTEPKGNVSYYLPNKKVATSVSKDSIPNYLIWYLKNTAWVKVGEERVMPTQCIFSSSFKSFAPLIYYVDFDFNNYTSERREVELLLEKLGFCFSITDFSIDAVYGILLDLPNKDEKGEVAVKLYRQIIENFDIDDKDNYPNRQKFIEEGSILSSYGAEGETKTSYVKVFESFYLNNPTFCGDIIKKFPVARVPKRRGNQKAQRIFGIKPLENIEFDLDENPVLHTLNSSFQKSFDSLKPYILSYRVYGKELTLKNEAKSLSELKLELCTRLNIKYEGDVFGINSYEFVQVKSEPHKMFISISDNITSLDELLRDIKFRSVIADILGAVFKINDSQEKFSLLISESVKSRRDDILQSFYMEDWENRFDKASKALGTSTRNEITFWTDMATLFQIELPEIYSKEAIFESFSSFFDLMQLKEIIRSIDYDNLNELKCLGLIKKLLDRAASDADVFNSLNKNSTIDFREFHRDKMITFLTKKKEEFQRLTYYSLKDSEIEKKRLFRNEREKLRSLYDFDFSSQKDFNYEGTYEKFIKELFDEKVISIEKEIVVDLIKERKRNRNLLNSKITNSAELNLFLDEPQNDSLLIFGEVDYLEQEFSKKQKSEIKENEEGDGEETDFSNLPAVNEWTGDTEENTQSTGRKTKRVSRAYPTGKSRNSSDKEKQSNGMRGERIVYNMLVKEHGKANVHWLSENGEKAGAILDGNDSLGYDISFIDENDEEYYVEVKATSGDKNEFFVSINECSTAEIHSDKYLVYFVKRVNSEENVSVHNLKDILTKEGIKKDAESYRISGFKLN